MATDLANSFNKPVLYSKAPTALIVEDNALYRRFLTKVMQQFGFCVVDVPSGDGALEAMRNNTTDIDLVLMDIGLEDGDGLAVAAALQAIANEKKLDQIVITGAPETVDPESVSWQMAGIRAVLAKPLAKTTLFSALAPWHKYLAHQQQQ